MATITKKESMLTTIDNPFDPFTQFQDWYTFDCEKGYYSYNYLDRIVIITNNMNQQQIDQAYEKGMKDIVAFNPSLYKIVSKDVEQIKEEIFI